MALFHLVIPITVRLSRSTYAFSSGWPDRMNAISMPCWAAQLLVVSLCIRDRCRTGSLTAYRSYWWVTTNKKRWFCPLSRCPENYGNSAKHYIDLLTNSEGIISLATFTISPSTSIFLEAARRTIPRIYWPQPDLQGVRRCSDALFGFI